MSPSAGAIVTRALSGVNGVEIASGFPFGPDFVGGVRIGAGDLSGDGVADLVVAMGPGGGLVTILDGNNAANLGSGYPFGTGFAGGVSVAVGDVNGDGRNDIVAAPATGGGTVFAVNGLDYSLLFAVAPFGGGYTGGMNVAAGDIDGDGRADIIVGQSNGGLAAIISAATQGVTASAAPFGNVNGVFVAAGDVNNDGRAEVIAAPGSGNGPVLIFDAFAQVLLAAPVPYPAGFTGGVRVAATDLTGDGRVEIITAPGPGIAPTLKLYDGATFANIANYAAYPDSFTSGTLIAAPAAAGIRFTSATGANLRPGTPASFTVSASGTPPVRTITVTGALPAGVSFTNNGNGTATLAGTVPAGTPSANYPLTFTASNGHGASSQQSFALLVGDGAAITSAASTAFSLGAARSFTVTTTGTPTPSVTSAGALPTGVSFVDNGNGSATIAGTAAGPAGSYPLTLTATNGVGPAATQNFVLSVQNGPVFTSAASTTFTVGVAGTFAVTTSAALPVTSIGRLGQVPDGLVFTDNGDGTGTLAGTPTLGSARTYEIDFTATTSAGIGTQAFTISVLQAPAITSASTTTFAQGAAGTFSVTTTGSPVATVSLTGTLPAGVAFINNGNGTATLAGTPAVNTAGSYIVTIRAANGAATQAVQSFTLHVTGAPAFTSAASAVFLAGAPGGFDIRASGGPPPTITFSGSLPAGLTLVDNGNGTATVAGTPGAGTGGNYPLTLTATNGIGSPATQNFVLTVNRTPAITSLNATAFTVNLAASFTVTTTGFPAPSVSVTGLLPTGITVTANPNGTATIAGTATQLGTFPLSVQASNGVGTPAAQNLSLTITNCTIVNLQPPAGLLAGGTYNTPYSQTFTATGGSGHTFAVTAGALPTGLALSPGGALTGSPSSPTSTGTFNFTVTATASGTGCASSSAYTLVVSPNAQNETYNNGVGNTQYSVGAGTPATPAVVVSGTVLTNDSGPGALSAGPGSIASTNGGQVTMAANGTFLYAPPAGFAGGSDTFTYTLSDGNGATDTAVVTVNLGGVVWYVDAAAGAGGSGRSLAPFNTMTAAASAAQNGQVIYVHSGSPAGATTLKASQRLQGAGEAYSLNGLTIAGGAAPTLQGTVTLANDVLVRALNVNAGGATAVAASGLTGTEVLAGVGITGGHTGLSLTGLSGTFSLSGTGISGVGAGGGVVMSGGTGSVNITSPINSASGRAVSVQNRTGGTVTFSGSITDTNSGILLNNNPGSTLAFTGGLALSSGTSTAFTATGGGTVTATQNNTSIVNAIATSSVSALHVANTQIGASGLTFRSIASAGGAGSGIILDNTGTLGSNGGLTVTGNGTAGSGGTISNKTGADGSLTQGVAIYLNSTRAPAFNRMVLQSSSNSSIAGRNVVGFLMADSVIDGAGTAAGVFEGPVVFGLPNPGGVNGLLGTATFRDTTIAGGIEHNVAAYGQSGSMGLVIDRTTLNPADCKVEANNGTYGGHGVLVQLEGNAIGSVTIAQCLLRGNRDAAVHATALGSSNLMITVNTADIGRSGQGVRGIVVTNGGDAALTATLTGNNFYDLTGPSIQLGQVPGAASAASLLRATILDNVVATANPVAGNTILATLSSSPGAAARTRLLLQDNFVEHNGLQPAVLIHAPDAGSAPAVDVTLIRNHVDMMEVSPGVNGPLGLVVRNTTQSATANLCANIAPNTFHWIPIENGTGGGISAELSAGSTFRLERGSQALGTAAATVLAANNGPHSGPPYGNPLPGSTTSVSGALTVAENDACVLPSVP